jgi:hypothetical protein
MKWLNRSARKELGKRTHPGFWLRHGASSLEGTTRWLKKKKKNTMPRYSPAVYLVFEKDLEGFQTFKIQLGYL